MHRTMTKEEKEILEEKMLYAKKENDSSYVVDYVEYLLAKDNSCQDKK